MDKGTKFIPCTHFTSFQFFSFILKSFDQNFNAFNSKLFLANRNEDKEDLYIVYIDPLINVNECFSEKCKHLKKSFNKLKLNASKNSLNFKFNFYKALSTLFKKKQSEVEINITAKEFESLKTFKGQNKYIVIECDKIIGTCIINKKLYEEFAFSHLNDRNVYTRI